MTDVEIVELVDVLPNTRDRSRLCATDRITIGVAADAIVPSVNLAVVAMAQLVAARPVVPTVKEIGAERIAVVLAALSTVEGITTVIDVNVAVAVAVPLELTVNNCCVASTAVVAVGEFTGLGAIIAVVVTWPRTEAMPVTDDGSSVLPELVTVASAVAMPDMAPMPSNDCVDNVVLVAAVPIAVLISSLVGDRNNTVVVVIPAGNSAVMKPVVETSAATVAMPAEVGWKSAGAITVAVVEAMPLTAPGATIAGADSVVLTEAIPATVPGTTCAPFCVSV